MEFSLDNIDLVNSIIAGIILISAIPSAFYIILGSDGLDLASIIISGGLSLALVVLYLQQHEILEKQTELMNREYQSALSKHPYVVAEGDDIILKLRNEGRGKVHRMFLKSEITSDTGEVEVAQGRSPVKKKSDSSVEIPTDSEREKYSGEVRLSMTSLKDSGGPEELPFKFISRRLSGAGIEKCTLRLTLEVLDERVSDGVFSYEIDVAEQELELNPPEVVDSDGKERPVVTSVEEGVKRCFSSDQDINKEWFESLQ